MASGPVLNTVSGEIIWLGQFHLGMAKRFRLAFYKMKKKFLMLTILAVIGSFFNTNGRWTYAEVEQQMKIVSYWVLIHWKPSTWLESLFEKEMRIKKIDKLVNGAMRRSQKHQQKLNNKKIKFMKEKNFFENPCKIIIKNKQYVLF